MDVDTTLEEFFNEILDGATLDVERTAELQLRLANLEKWHCNRGFLPRWPMNLSPARAGKLVVIETEANPSARAELIALMARIQTVIEAEHRGLYLDALGSFRSWLSRFGAKEE